MIMSKNNRDSGPSRNHPAPSRKANARRTNPGVGSRKYYVGGQQF